jgi:hypothetical protein
MSVCFRLVQVKSLWSGYLWLCQVITCYVMLVQERSAYVGIGHVRSRYTKLVLVNTG